MHQNPVQFFGSLKRHLFFCEKSSRLSKCFVVMLFVSQLQALKVLLERLLKEMWWALFTNDFYWVYFRTFSKMQCSHALLSLHTLTPREKRPNQVHCPVCRFIKAIKQNI